MAALLETRLPAAKPSGQPPTVDLRAVINAILNAILYVLCTGCPWRYLPHASPKWQTVYHYFACWRDNGTLHRVLEQVLRPAGHEFVLMPRRWAMERTFGWFRWCRLVSSSESGL